MDDHFEVVDTYQSYVKPEFGTMDAVIIDLTGITDDKVKDAPGFAEAMDDFTEWIGPGGDTVLFLEYVRHPSVPARSNI